MCLCPTQGPLDWFYQSMSEDYTLTDEGDVNEYLGLKVDRHADGSIELRQPHLIDKILETAGLKADSKTHRTPAAEVLQKYLESEPMPDGFPYRSLVGQLNYLAATTRPDIAFAVHQCARFSNNPREPHMAVKHIIRYL